MQELPVDDAVTEQRVALPDGTHLAVQARGAGPAVLLISGVAADHTAWGPYPQRLAEQFRVITYDHRGTGASDDATDEQLTTRALARDAADLLRALGVEHAHVYGHSMGGRVAQWVAIDSPELVQTLTLGATTGGDRLGIPRPAEVTRVMATATPEEMVDFSLSPDSRHDPVARAAIGTRGTSPEAVRHHIAASTAHDAWDDLDRISAPTLILHGTGDQVTPYGNAERLAARLPQAVLHPLSGAGHAFPLEHNDAHQTFLDFVARADQAPGAGPQR